MTDLEDQRQEDPESALIQSGSRSGRSENNSKVELSGNDQVATTSSVSKIEKGCENFRQENLDASEKEDAGIGAQLAPIVKYVYTEDPEVSGMSTRQAEKWRRENFDIQVWRTIDHQSKLKLEHEQPDLKPIPNPVLTFEQAFKNYPEIMKKIKKHGFKKPSPIQSQVWPMLLGGEDLKVTAPNGTGKTLAYLLPALIHIKGQIRPKKGRRDPIVLILVPESELAIQIHRVICNFIDKDIKSVCLYGGNNQNKEIEVINKGVDIVVATPGRLKELIRLQHLYAINFTYIVYDEADKLFDKELSIYVRPSLFSARPDHQRILLSATWVPWARPNINYSFKNITEITVGSLEMAPIRTVTQHPLFLTFEERDKVLLTFVRNMKPTDKVIIFCDKNCAVSHVSSDLAVKGIYCAILHSRLEQEERDEAFDAILQGSTNILVATDIASRGIDIKDVTHVINYGCPQTFEDYVHRIGRTGRAGKSGRAITYITKYDLKHVNGLIKKLKKANKDVANKFEFVQRCEPVQQKNKRHIYP